MQKALGLLVVVAIARMFLVGGFELAPDEAYYLSWAMPSPPVHVDHPPLVSWMASGAWALVHAGAPLETAARIGSIILLAATGALLVETASALGASANACVLLAFLASFLPLPSAGALLLTPDAPLCFAFALGLLALAPCPKAWKLGAFVLAAALAPLAKVNGYLLVPTILAARHLAKSPPLPRAIVIAATLAAFATLPLTLPSLRFQLAHAFTTSGPSLGLDAPPPFPLAGVPIFLLGQLALVLPALFLFQAPTNAASRLTLVAAVLPAVPSLLSAFVRVPEPNWTAPAYPGLLLFLAVTSDALPADTRAFRTRVALAATTGVALLLHVHLLHPILPLSPDKDATARLHGWRRFACEAGPPPVLKLPPYGFISERDVYRTTCPRAPGAI